MNPSRGKAWELLNRYTKNRNLIKHGLAVEAAMRHYAKIYNEDEELWGTVGLLHDFDWEQFPTLEGHPIEGQKILEAEGYDETVRRAIMAHAPHTGTTRDTKLEKTIFAVDELTGFIVAVALIKPSKKLSEVDVESVKKKMGQKAFAAAVKREDIIKGAEDLGITLDEHVKNVLEAMQGIANELGL